MKPFKLILRNLAMEKLRNLNFYTVEVLPPLIPLPQAGDPPTDASEPRRSILNPGKTLHSLGLEEINIT